MPDKPIWFGRLDEVIAELEALPHPWIDRAGLERLLGVGRRRAQQILRPCVTHQIGSSGVADRDKLIARLKELAHGETAYYEQRRRRQLAESIEKLRQAWLETPRVVVEAPEAISKQEFDDLPSGVHVGPGAITVEFGSVQEGLAEAAGAGHGDRQRFRALRAADSTGWAWASRSAPHSACPTRSQVVAFVTMEFHPSISIYARKAIRP